MQNKGKIKRGIYKVRIIAIKLLLIILKTLVPLINFTPFRYGKSTIHIHLKGKAAI